VAAAAFGAPRSANSRTRNRQRTQNSQKKKLRAVVIGAGVAGLTAAHELAERHFKVWVVESTRDVNRHAQVSMAIGGMARTQYVAAKKVAAANGMIETMWLTPVMVFEKQHLDEQLDRYVKEFLQKSSDLELYGPDDLRAKVKAKLPRTASIHEGEFWPPQYRKDQVALVRRPRMVWIDVDDAGRWSPADSDRLNAFLEHLEPGDSVRLRYREDKNVGPLMRLLNGRHFDVVAETHNNRREDRIELATRTRTRRTMEWVVNRPAQLSGNDRQRLHGFLKKWRTGEDTVTLHYKKGNDVAGLKRFLGGYRQLKVVDDHENKNDNGVEVTLSARALEEPTRLTLHPNPKQGLEPDGNRELTKFLERVDPGDIVEIHVKDPNAATAVRQIKAALRRRNVTPVLAASEVLCMRALSAVDQEYVIPGEHGFRFFPAYYRHLRNTLERIPVFETSEGHNPYLTSKLSGRWVADNLVNTPVQAFAGKGTTPALFPRSPAVSLTAKFIQLRDLLIDRGYDLRDIDQFVLRVLRYMATGCLRRNEEYDKISWWEYLCGYNPASGTYRYQYREAFKKHVSEAPRILAAFDAQSGDAHSDGNTFVQLLLSNVLESKIVDQVLNAPTTEAWFEHWEKYLKEYLGVTFVSAEVSALTGSGRGPRRVKPVLEPVDPAVDSVDELQKLINADKIDYFVMATDAPAAESLVTNLGENSPRYRKGICEELEYFTTKVRGNPDENSSRPVRRKTKQYGEATWDRFQTLTGIQFYFVNVTGIFNGHVYFMDSQSALSSINQQQFWRFNTIARGAPFQSVLSADIGKFDWKLRDGEAVAKEVWSEILEALENYWSPDENSAALQKLNKVGPQWFHLDKNIDLSAKINRSPYLIPMKADWNNRPHDTLWDPSESESTEGMSTPIDDVWQARWGGYRVHWGKWVFAGVYLKHFTRMTTMEAANESARHAVNAILDNLTYGTSRQRRPAPTMRKRYPSGGNALDPHAAYVPTPYGDYCHIFNSENYELDDMAPLRELDDWLFEHDLPHVFDLLGHEILPSLISFLPSAQDLKLPSIGDLLKALKPPFPPLTLPRDDEARV
jgi:hypothetical protein